MPGNEEEGGGEAGAAAREHWATCGSAECVSTLLHLSARPLHIHSMSQPRPPPTSSCLRLPLNTSQLCFVKGERTNPDSSVTVGQNENVGDEV